MFLAVHGDDARIAVGLAGMVDEARGVAVHRCVHHLIVVDAKHVTADSLWESEETGAVGLMHLGRDRQVIDPHLSTIIFLPLVGEHGSNDISGIFNDHFASLNGFLTEETSAMNR